LRGYLAPAGGVRRRPGNWPADEARPGTAPPSHSWRALPDSARQEHLVRAATPTTAGMPAAMIWLRPSRARFPGPPRRQQTRAGPPQCEPARLDAAPSRAETPPGAALRHGPLPTGNQLLNPVVDGDRRLPFWLVAVAAPSYRACGEHPVLPSWAMSPRPRPYPRPAGRPSRASTGTLTRCYLPARHANVSQVCCAQPCGSLV
jgi:hypothetical protein